jgi:hypothetical protein
VIAEQHVKRGFCLALLIGTSRSGSQLIVAEYEKRVREKLVEHGCTFVRHGKGDHEIWYSPVTGKNITVDKKIKSRHTANAIMKQSGINHHF